MKISICAAKRVLCFMLCVLVLGVTGLFGGTNKVLAEIQIDTNTDVINLQNDRFALSLNKANDLLTLTDLSNGCVWNSIVADGLQDENAEGIAKTDLMSQLIVTYKSAMMTEMATNSYSDCVMNKTVEYSVDKNTITVVYKFKKLGFSIPVRFTITDDGFTSEIDAKNIIEGENSILSISLLPYFGAAGSKDTGYMVVPDGSGAVVNFNNRNIQRQGSRKINPSFLNCLRKIPRKAIRKIIPIPFGADKQGPGTARQGIFQILHKSVFRIQDCVSNCCPPL